MVKDKCKTLQEGKNVVFLCKLETFSIDFFNFKTETSKRFKCELKTSRFYEIQMSFTKNKQTNKQFGTIKTFLATQKS